MVRIEVLGSEMSSSVKVKEVSSEGQSEPSLLSTLTEPLDWSAELKLTFHNSFSRLSSYRLSSGSELQPANSAGTEGGSSLRHFYKCECLTLLGKALYYIFSLHPQLFVIY